MTLPDLVLLLGNVVYATAFLAARIALDDVPPATLALARLVLAALVLSPAVLAARRSAGAKGRQRLGRRDAWRVALMGLVGFGAAYALSHWGLAASTVTHAAFLIVLEPVAIMLLAPVTLGERLTAREAAGAVLAVVGAVLVIANGVPGVGGVLFPTWRGDSLLLLAAVAYATYSLLGRDVLARHRALPVTVASILWGAVSILPLAVMEWAAGVRPQLTVHAVAATVYLALVITGLGYLAWNWALRRVPASRAAIFLTVQPVVGALSGVLVRGESLGVFTVLGGVLIVGGLIVTVGPGRARGAAPGRAHEAAERATVASEHASSAPP